MTGLTRKHCYFCGRETVHEIDETGEFKAYICLDRTHALARQQYLAEQDDPAGNRTPANMLRGE